jgi:flagellar basal body-associated protein FliL
MGEEEKEEIIPEEEEEAPKEEVAGRRFEASKIIKTLLYVAGGVLLVVLVTGISYLVSKYVQESSYQSRQDIVAAPPPPPLASFELPDISKTTADAEPHFVKMKISLAYEPSVGMNNELAQRRDQIMHIVNIVLQGKKYEELNSVSSTIALAEEIKAHINVVLIAGRIKEVYFKEFVVN